MPIRFRCKRCYQMLGIASRKAGAEIRCPKCAFSQIVPSEEAAAAALAMDQFARNPLVTDAASDLVVYDDAPTAIEMPRPRREPAPAAEKSAIPPAEGRTAAATAPPGKTAASSGGGATSAGSTAPSPARSPARVSGGGAVAKEPAATSALAEGDRPVAGEPVPRGMILFPRHTFYVQGVLFVVLAAVTFAAGYLMGRGDARVERQRIQEELAKERVLVEGTLLYKPGPNRVEPDNRAVVMALPVGKFPEKKLTFQGIRPADRDPAPSHPTVRQIGELGGVYARADDEGSFDMVVPDKGKYWVLLVSAHAGRSKDNDIDEPDLEQLGNYFSQPELLIGRFKYRFTEEEIDSGFNPIDHDFGLDQRE